ncbi:putative serine/threonine protein kinase IREH1 [Heracleum sosnowskyi]|uniref:non-specific serine/threonine protein kinase n=1 Tax=Heracleum sosnowskyi TaxID=360622 RepID=A0AAD8HRI8_9APIA|nr:putative serine/threonine protein kinase IREH1 [Heracleum sosnowskyi]
MVFKGRLFSSKKSSSTSSPDGSNNSPRSFGSSSSSPTGSDKKKVKSKPVSIDDSHVSSPSSSGTSTKQDKKKITEVKNVKLSSNSKSISPSLSNSGSGKVKSIAVRNVKNEVKTDLSSIESSISGAGKGKKGGEGLNTVSPILASSLGLNRIKTRSGPLPQESFFGFGSSSGRDGGSGYGKGGIGVSNLSKGGKDVGRGKGDLRKKDLAAENVSFGGWADNGGGNSRDSMSAEGAALTDQSPLVQGRSRLQNGETSSSDAGHINSSSGHPGVLRSADLVTPEAKTPYDCENPKESESPRFQAILRVTSAPRVRFPADIKSFSHELNSKGVRPFPLWKPRRSNNLEEVLVMIRAKFDKAKEEVDSDLRVFAAHLVETLDKNAESHPEWQETIEDLLVMARSCAMTSAGEFWLQCEGIVQDLDDRRQDLPMGILKQLHTRMLFILTRCTRLLQFHKESGFAEDEHALNLRQSLHTVYERIPGGAGRSVTGSGTAKASKAASRKSYSQEQHALYWKKDQATQPESFLSPPSLEISQNLDSPSTRDRMASWKKFPSPGVKSPQKAALSEGVKIGVDPEASEVLNNRKGSSDMDISTPKSVEHPAKDFHGQPSKVSKHQHKPSWGHWGDQTNVSDESIICRICEEEVPTLHVEDHSRICAIADQCDQKGVNVDVRLVKISETLEKLMESLSQKDFQHIGSPDVAKVSNSSIIEECDLHSPKLSDWSRRGSEDMLDCFPEADNSVFMDDLKSLPSMSCRTRFGPKSDHGMTTSSGGSMTPRSPVTPQTNPIDLLLAGKGSYSEYDDLPQMTELADIARCASNTPLEDDRSSPYLLTCLEDLRVVIDHKKFDSLTVETFGARIEKLIREKYLQLCEMLDDEKVDITSTVIDEDAPLDDDVVRSLRTSPIHSSKDRTSIDDFEIIKPISRGAFGRVFLAKKRTTGDLFAIKVLKKADMVRKNAVESILAERDILIAVRNPFVVRFFYSFTCRENLYLVMEYLNGGDLYSLLRNLGCLDEDVARVYIAEVVLALEYLHSLRIVHRDLKPDNLLIAHDGHLKLTDFGLSKVGLINSTDDLSGPAVSGASLLEVVNFQLSASQHQQERRSKRSAVGTPDYLAPEILLGTGHGTSADWWSVGVILFELIVGIPPFNAEHPQIIFDNILNRNIPWPQVPEEMSSEAADLIDWLLREDPNQRLGARGASEVKQHPFFRDINWNTLARQKAAFVPASESPMDTSYFTSRFTWNPSDEHVHAGSEFENSSDNGSISGSSSCHSNRHDDVGHEYAGVAEYESGSSVNYSFSNFSFKNLSELASINYDLLTKGWKEESPTNPST